MVRAVLTARLVLSLSLAACASISWAATPRTRMIYVDCTNTTGIHDGSEAHPYNTIQEGINAAIDGDTVMVRPCIYCENINFLGKAITVSSADPLDPAIVETTVIDGGGAGSVVTFTNSEGESSVLAGFTIRNGSGTLVGGAYYGGGIYCNSSSPTIANNTITGNNARDRGGGIYCNSSSPGITDNIITGNSAGYDGGAIYCSSSSPGITNNTVSANSAGGHGAGIYCYVSSPTISNDIVTANDARFGNGGGIACVMHSAPVITANNVAANIAERGGGVYCYYASPNIINNAITGGNHADTYGGGVYCYHASPTIINNTISGNSGEIGGGGVYCVFLSSPTLTNNIITGNSTLLSGGARCYDRSSPIITNCTVADNVGGGIGARTDSLPVVTNCIVWDGICVDSTSPIDVTYSDACTGGQDPWPGEANICAAPGFADPGSGDYHIALGSACIGAGLNANAPPDDLDGDPRPLPAGGRVDIGADEWVPTSPLCFQLRGNCWHMIAPPCQAVAPDPWEVFDELRPPNKPIDLLSGNLHRYDRDAHRYVTYYHWAPAEFGPVRPGDGYWLWLFEDESICYRAECSGVPAMTDFPAPGWHLVGSPRPADTYIAHTLWHYGGIGPLPFASVMNTWVQDPLVGWSPSWASYLTCGLLQTDNDHYLRAFHGYWLYTFVANVTVEMPPP